LLITLYLADVDQRGILDVTATTLGILSSVFYIVELGFSPIMGVKSDQYGNRTMLLVGPMFGVVAVLFASIAAFSGVLGISQLAIGGISVMLLALGVTRLMQGFAAAASIPSILSYLSVRTEGSLALRGRVMSVFEITTAIGLLLGPVIGAQLWKFTGPWGFLITGLLFLCSGAVFLIVREDRASHRRVTTASGEGIVSRLKRVLRRRDLLIFAPAWMAVNAIVGMWGVHLVYQMKNGNLADAQFLTGSVRAVRRGLRHQHVGWDIAGRQCLHPVGGARSGHPERLRASGGDLSGAAGGRLGTRPGLVYGYLLRGAGAGTVHRHLAGWSLRRCSRGQRHLAADHHPWCDHYHHHLPAHATTGRGRRHNRRAADGPARLIVHRESGFRQHWEQRGGPDPCIASKGACLIDLFARGAARLKPA
jgi:hypothetical protein